MDVTQYQKINFGNNTTKNPIVVKRKASGDGIVFLNPFLPPGTKVRFDDNPQEFEVLPREPIFYKFRDSITLTISPTWSAVLGSYNVTDISDIIAVVFPNTEEYFRASIPWFESYYMAGFSTVNTSQFYIYNPVGAKELNITMAAQATNRITCWGVYEWTGYSGTGNQKSVFHGYLSAAQGTEHEDDYLIIRPKNTGLIVLSLVYENSANSTEFLFTWI